MRAIDGDILEKKLKDAINMCMSIDTSGLSELKAVLEDVEEMPTIEPEIVRCKDCKYWMPHSQLGFDEDNETYHDYCKNLIPEDEYYAFYRCADDYCSFAERRTDEQDSE